jgi:hypothetical protein
VIQSRGDHSIFRFDSLGAARRLLSNDLLYRPASRRFGLRWQASALLVCCGWNTRALCNLRHSESGVALTLPAAVHIFAARARRRPARGVRPLAVTNMTDSPENRGAESRKPTSARSWLRTRRRDKLRNSRRARISCNPSRNCRNLLISGSKSLQIRSESTETTSHEPRNRSRPASAGPCGSR